MANIRQVLLLEDEPVISMGLETALMEAGYLVSVASTCAQASSWLDSHRLPDIVVVDIELRDGPCTEVVARLVDANVPFMVYAGDMPSAHLGTPFARNCKWINKPATDYVLVEAVGDGLQDQRRQLISSALNWLKPFSLSMKRFSMEHHFTRTPSIILFKVNVEC